MLLSAFAGTDNRGEPAVFSLILGVRIIRLLKADSVRHCDSDCRVILQLKNSRNGCGLAHPTVKVITR